MKRLSHVLILIILVLPILVVVPTSATMTTESVNAQTSFADFSLAQFKEERVRVAVYAEDNVSLPAYATGGVYTSNYGATADMLELQGYAVTELTTEDIENHELMTRNFDVFVLPDQLPRENITNLVKDFWLAGGGILSLHSSMGYMYYHGMIVPGDEGNFALLGVDPTPYWGYAMVGNMSVAERNPVTKAFQVGDQINLTEYTVILNRNDLDMAIGGDYGDLLYQYTNPTNGLGFSIDNGARPGGRIVQLSGNYSSPPTWFSTIAGDAVDWLNPRPRARIGFDMSHSPYLPIDIWDDFMEPYFLTQWRNGLVNHTYTVDKFYSSMTLANMMSYDMFVISLPTVNFTAQEVQDVQSYVDAGGGLLLVADVPGLGNMDSHLNYLLSSFDISIHDAYSSGFGVLADYPELLSFHEAATSTEFDASCAFNITGDAFPIWTQESNILSAAQEYGNGRILVVGDVNLFSDGLAILEQQNYRYTMNIANWLSSATADVLLMNGEFMDDDIYRVAPALALNSLGVNYYVTHTPFYLNLSLYEYWDQWDLVIVDEPGLIIAASILDSIDEWVDSGGELIMSYYWMHNIADHPLWASLGVYPVLGSADEPDIHIWATGHPIFNLPADYGESLFQVTVDYGTEGSKLHVFGNATAVAGYTVSAEANETAIAVRNDQQTLVNGFLIDEFQGDYDESTYMDSFELWVNEIGFMYFERPTIDSPADLTYVEGETGNEIVWTPTADAGPFRYVLNVNGSPDTLGTWNGAPIAVNVDNVNVSITSYQLTVIDRLGYSATDTVILNVTAYIPPPLGGLDPLLLIAIGAGIVILIVVVLIVQKRGKK